MVIILDDFIAGLGLKFALQVFDTRWQCFSKKCQFGPIFLNIFSFLKTSLIRINCTMFCFFQNRQKIAPLREKKHCPPLLRSGQKNIVCGREGVSPALAFPIGESLQAWIKQRFCLAVSILMPFFTIFRCKSKG